MSQAGYPSTTVPMIAERTAVSGELVFKLVGSKRAVLEGVSDLVAGGGEEDVAFLDWSTPQAMRRNTNQCDQLRLPSSQIPRSRRCVMTSTCAGAGRR